MRNLIRSPINCAIATDPLLSFFLRTDFSQCVPATADSSTLTPSPTTTSKVVSVTASATTIFDPYPTNLKYWFSFGDSYRYVPKLWLLVSNSKIACGSQTWFNISGVKPTVGNPMGNPDYPGWTACPGGTGDCTLTLNMISKTDAARIVKYLTGLV